MGVDEYYAEVLPEDKAAFVEKEKAKGRKVIMIGDGIMIRRLFLRQMSVLQSVMALKLPARLLILRWARMISTRLLLSNI